MEKLIIRRPDDWHCHLRDGHYLARTAVDQAHQFRRSIVMPNLQPPVTTVEHAVSYRQNILSYLRDDTPFEPLMTLYLTPQCDHEQLVKAQQSPFIKAIKLYPKGATTNSESGVNCLKEIYPCLASMEQLGLVLAVHGEVTDPHVDIFDREAVFLERALSDIVETFPKLKVVLEHISTQEAVNFVRQAGDCVAATITPHHLLLNRNHLLSGGIKPHYYCLPIVKKRQDQQALLEAAVSGDGSFFLGTDSAPHAKHQKESACGCAGVYSAHAAIELYAQVFEEQGALDQLENFSSRFGAEFYGMPLNDDCVTLQRAPWQVPDFFEFGQDVVVPLFAGRTLQWKLCD